MKREPQDLRKRARHLREQGYTHKGIASRIGVTEKTVANWLRMERTEHEQKAIAELKAEGCDPLVIEAVFGRGA